MAAIVAFEVPEIGRRIRERRLESLLPEMRNLDGLLTASRSHVRRALVEGDYLLPVHQRQLHLCRRIAAGIGNGTEPREELARWIYLRVKEIESWIVRDGHPGD